MQVWLAGAHWPAESRAASFHSLALGYFVWPYGAKSRSRCGIAAFPVSSQKRCGDTIRTAGEGEKKSDRFVNWSPPRALVPRSLSAKTFESRPHVHKGDFSHAERSIDRQ
jgi:hypothetical protein